jgi:hypothetical protein
MPPINHNNSYRKGSLGYGHGSVLVKLGLQKVCCRVQGRWVASDLLGGLTCMAAANPGGSHGRGGGVASAAARTSRALAAAPRVRVVGGENLLCAPAGRKHKEKFSQAPDMSMVQVLMQQTTTGVIHSQLLAPKAAQSATLAASSAASAALGVLCAQLGIPVIVPPGPAASKPKSQKRTRATGSMMPRQRLHLHTRQRRLVQRLVLW